MPTLFQKLNLKDESPVVVLDGPPEFESVLATLDGVPVRRDVPADAPVAFAIAFCRTQAEVEAAATALAARAAPDAKLWFAYPKQSSKRHRCEFNRDTGWAVLGALGYEAVRQVAIDEDWSALRFRQVAYIATMTRDASRAMSAAGKRRTAPRR